MATLPANLPDDHPRPAEVPVIGFIAHVDTYQGTKGSGVRPSIFHDYDGSRIVLKEGVVLDPDVDQGLRQLVGDDIVHTDGTTLLGADDKAGVAEIMHALTLLTTDPAIHHGPIRVAFTVDEEIARGADHFDIAHFGAAFAYTMDGSGLGEIENETFCADTATIRHRRLRRAPRVRQGQNGQRRAGGGLHRFPVSPGRASRNHGRPPGLPAPL